MTYQQRRLAFYGVILSRIPTNMLDTEYDLERQEALAASDTVPTPHTCPPYRKCSQCASALAEAQAEAAAIRRQRMRIIREMQKLVGVPMVALDA